jgi:hypothetical protein
VTIIIKKRESQTIIKAGKSACKKVRISPRPIFMERYLIDGTVKDGQLTNDVAFTAKSQAAKVLLGYSISGNVA